ncbi:MAG TPA: tetratricopeptide repeat protein [Phycisphaerales bacterium]|nr:tetratricopeptide repeat protein [Phycisphaerales bacterium]
MKWKRSKKQPNSKVARCPHCGKPLEADKAEKPKKWYEKTSVTLCMAAGLAVIGLGFIHIITGVVSPFQLPFDVVRKESFGYRETFVNAEQIKALRYTAAKIKYPLGCKALQRTGYMESGKVFETREANRLKDDMKKWQAQLEKTLGRQSRRWQDRLVGQTDSAGMDPEDANAYNARGIISAEKGQYESAISNFTRASQRDPVFADAYFNRGLVYVAIGQLGQAIADFGRAVEIKATFARGYIERGLIHAGMDRHEQAVADFTKAVEIDPALSEIYLRRSLVCCTMGKYDQAWNDVHKIESLGLNVPTGYLAYLRAASERQK